MMPQTRPLIGSSIIEPFAASTGHIKSTLDQSKSGPLGRTYCIRPVVHLREGPINRHKTRHLV